MTTTIRYILLTALRDKLFFGLFLGIVAAVMISHAMGGTALVETVQMILAYAGASCRLIIVVGLIVFVCFHIRQAFDSKEIDVILSRPISRTQLLLSYWLGFAVVATLLVIPTTLIILGIGMLNIQLLGNWLPGFLDWSFSLWLETLLIVAMALFAAFTLKSAVSAVMASFGFYVLSRMMGFFVATSKSAMLFKSDGINEVIRFVINGISIVMPRLDFFSKTEWLVYGVKSVDEILHFVIQAAIFIPLLLLAARADILRKQF